MSVEPLARRTTSEQVAHEIRRRIWSGELRAGDRLGQEELAEAMGVSRIPVREALIGLAHEGSVRSEPHRGSFVEALTPEGVADHYELYALIDGFALRKAVHRADADELARLADEMASAADIDEAAAMQDLVVAARRRFHELGGSPRFHTVARGLTGLVAGNFFDEVDGALAVTRRRFPEVGEALRARAADGAADRYRLMMREHGELVLDDLHQRGVID